MATRSGDMKQTEISGNVKEDTSVYVPTREARAHAHTHTHTSENWIERGKRMLTSCRVKLKQNEQWNWADDEPSHQGNISQSKCAHTHCFLLAKEARGRLNAGKVPRLLLVKVGLARRTFAINAFGTCFALDEQTQNTETKGCASTRREMCRCRCV